MCAHQEDKIDRKSSQSRFTENIEEEKRQLKILLTNKKLDKQVRETLLAANKLKQSARFHVEYKQLTPSRSSAIKTNKTARPTNNSPSFITEAEIPQFQKPSLQMSEETKQRIIFLRQAKRQINKYIPPEVIFPKSKFQARPKSVASLKDVNGDTSTRAQTSVGVSAFIQPSQMNRPATVRAIRSRGSDFAVPMDEYSVYSRPHTAGINRKSPSLQTAVNSSIRQLPYYVKTLREVAIGNPPVEAATPGRQRPRASRRQPTWKY